MEAGDLDGGAAGYRENCRGSDDRMPGDQSSMKNGVGDIFRIGIADGKFSPGSFSLSDFSHSTFWVVLLCGFFINLNNFGMDQNYVQRYHTARSEKKLPAVSGCASIMVACL